MQWHCPLAFLQGPFPPLKLSPMKCTGTNKESYEECVLSFVPPHLYCHCLCRSSLRRLSFHQNKLEMDWTWVDIYWSRNLKSKFHNAPHTKGELRKVCGAWIIHPLDIGCIITLVHTSQVVTLDMNGENIAIIAKATLHKCPGISS